VIFVGVIPRCGTGMALTGGFGVYLTDVGGVMQRQVSASLRAQAKQSIEQ
jgi:hypothetical protein